MASPLKTRLPESYQELSETALDQYPEDDSEVFRDTWMGEIEEKLPFNIFPDDGEPLVTGRGMNDTDILNIGVHHAEKPYNDNKEFFNEVIETSDAIVLEGRIPTNHEFFGEIEESTHSADTIVYTPDPETAGTGLLDFGQFLSGIPVIHCIDNPDYSQLLSETAEYASDIAPEAAAATAATYLFLSSGFVSTGRDMSKILRRQSTLQQSNFDKISYGAVDFRDTYIAEGTEQITETEDHDSVALIHGMFHRAGIDYYLDNPDTRETKQKFYGPYRKLGDTNIQRHQPTEDGWETEILGDLD